MSLNVDVNREVLQIEYTIRNKSAEEIKLDQYEAKKLFDELAKVFGEKVNPLLSSLPTDTVLYRGTFNQDTQQTSDEPILKPPFYHGNFVNTVDYESGLYD